MLDACRKRGVSVADADRLLAPVYAAMEAQLPVDCLYERIDEGLAKNVGADVIEAAVERRLECLRVARELLAEVAAGESPAGPPMLLSNIGMALESGVSPEVIKTAFQRKGPLRYGRIAHVVEAAEALHLAGLKSDEVACVMNDFLDRDMIRSEIVRVVELLQKGLSEGMPFDELYASIWGLPIRGGE